jgi:hypothetical protein
MAYPGDAGRTVDKHASPADLLLDELVEPFEEGSDIFVFAVEEGVDDVLDALGEGDVVHGCSCSNDYVFQLVPVAMLQFKWNCWSAAEWKSPMKMAFPVDG